MCFAADAMQVILLSFLTVVLRKEWELTEQMAAFLTSGLFAGSMLGTLVLGPLADNIGRRPVFLIAGMVISIFGTGASMAINYWIFVCQIFMVGFGVGGYVYFVNFISTVYTNPVLIFLLSLQINRTIRHSSRVFTK